MAITIKPISQVQIVASYNGLFTFYVDLEEVETSKIGKPFFQNVFDFFLI